MSRDHIIPRFILKGFSINPAVNKKNQKIMIYDTSTAQVTTRKIVDAYAISDFNSPETEKYLAQEYESSVSKIFQRITENALKNCNSVILSKFDIPEK